MYKRGAAMTWNTPINTILIAINLTDASRRAFYAGLDLAAKYGAQAHVLHVSEPIRAFDFGKKRYIETKDTIERVEEGVKARVDALWAEGGLEAVDRRKIHLIVRGGKAVQEIIDTAVAKQADLIVMGQGSGTVASEVTRGAPCSTFCVREPSAN